MAFPVMTITQPHSLPAGAGARLRRHLTLAIVASSVLALLFAAGAIAGLLIARRLWWVGSLLTIAYLAGAVIALGVLSAAYRGRRAIVADNISLTAGRRARTAARTQVRLSRTAATLTAVAAIAVAFVQGDASQALLGILCALPLLSLASVARSVNRRLTRLLP
jgi:hypothetical protein